MLLEYEDLTIRDAREEDAKLLAAWWSDGRESIPTHGEIRLENCRRQ